MFKILVFEIYQRTLGASYININIFDGKKILQVRH